MDFKLVGQELVDLLATTAKAEGKELKTNAKVLALYVEERAGVLSKAVGQPGYSEALVAERDNVVMKAAGWAIDEGDAFDAKFSGLVQGALHIAVSAL